MRPENFFNIDASRGVERELAPGLTATVFPGEEATVSIVRLAPGARGTEHAHPQEQWGFCIEGSATRFQGEDAVAVAKGDFWRTPGNVAHTIEAGPEGCVVIDVFAPPRRDYETPGAGFGSAST